MLSIVLYWFLNWFYFLASVHTNYALHSKAPRPIEHTPFSTIHSFILFLNYFSIFCFSHLPIPFSLYFWMHNRFKKSVVIIKLEIVYWWVGGQDAQLANMNKSRRTIYFALRIRPISNYRLNARQMRNFPFIPHCSTIWSEREVGCNYLM